jgi:hypothetical protein
MTSHVTLVKINTADISGQTLPSVDPGSNVLIDDDARVCRVITDDERDAASIDRNIDTFQLQDINLLTLDVDNHNVTITYTGGASITILLGSIDYAAPVRAAQYGQRNGLIFPIDADGTPNLVAIRTWYFNEAKRVNDQRLEIAETVHAFADAINNLSSAAD